MEPQALCILNNLTERFDSCHFNSRWLCFLRASCHELLHFFGKGCTIKFNGACLISRLQEHPEGVIEGFTYIVHHSSMATTGYPVVPDSRHERCLFFFDKTKTTLFHDRKLVVDEFISQFIASQSWFIIVGCCQEEQRTNAQLDLICQTQSFLFNGHAGVIHNVIIIDRHKSLRILIQRCCEVRMICINYSQVCLEEFAIAGLVHNKSSGTSFGASYHFLNPFLFWVFYKVNTTNSR